ncbi:hypothetical protein BDW22DRAFT_78430 [Trametopsis cervina]|nr:hypothetical protein BDW22DRAFT_78430 [Trametopsis cervina]
MFTHRSDPRSDTSIISPPPTYGDSTAVFDPMSRWNMGDRDDETSTISDFDRSSVYTPTDRRPSTASADPSTSAFHDRRFSMASDVLPLEIEHQRQRSSASSTGSGSYHNSPLSPEEAILNAAGLPTPPSSALRRSPSSIVNPSSSGHSDISYLTISEGDDPAVLGSFPASHGSLSPLSTGTFGSYPSHHPQSPLIHTISRSPSYATPQLQVPCTCAFYDIGVGAIALHPPADTPNPTPLYIIKVTPNVFMPTSYITTVERGGPIRQLVARFEMGLTRDPATLFMGNQRYRLSDVFSNFRRVGSRLGQDRWKWVRGRYDLQWNCVNNLEPFCHFDKDPNKTPLAKLIPAIAAYAPDAMISAPGPPATKLMVLSPDLALLDEIIVSALIVERKRQTPTEGNQNKDLFN